MVIYHYCFAYDWRAVFCYDVADWSEPVEVD